MRFRCIGGRARAQKQQRPTSIMRGPLGALYSCAVRFAGVTSPEELMDDKDLESRTEMSHSRSRRKFLYAVGGAGIVSAAGWHRWAPSGVPLRSTTGVARWRARSR